MQVVACWNHLCPRLFPVIFCYLFPPRMPSAHHSLWLKSSFLTLLDPLGCELALTSALGQLPRNGEEASRSWHDGSAPKRS